jgi:hypothetical protein
MKLCINYSNHVDNDLYNNTFGSYNFTKYSNCNSFHIQYKSIKIELNYLKFLFSINSPLYRIYFLFIFIKIYDRFKFYKFFDNNNIYNNEQSDINVLRDLLLSFYLIIYTILIILI